MNVQVPVGDKTVDRTWVMRLLSRQDEKLRFKIAKLVKNIYGDDLCNYWLSPPVDDSKAKQFPDSMTAGIAGECYKIL